VDGVRHDAAAGLPRLKHRLAAEPVVDFLLVEGKRIRSGTHVDHPRPLALYGQTILDGHDDLSDALEHALSSLVDINDLLSVKVLINKI